ncbi:MAG: agmatinase [Acidobacteriota bacterium]
MSPFEDHSPDGLDRAPQPNFLGLEPPLSDYATARSAILPVPLERTVSYGGGTARGPRAILDASLQVELYDEETGLDLEQETDASRYGIATLPPADVSHPDLGDCLEALRARCREVMEDGKFLLTLGGEHSLTIAPVRAARDVFGQNGDSIGVVQFDAHADLRDAYEGTPHSHACVMKRVYDEGIAHLGVGIRSLSGPEAELIRNQDIPILWARDLALKPLESTLQRFDQALARLPHQIYLTFDIDFFDPSLVPATGTPEPGGGTWYPTLALLRRLYQTKTVVAADLVELAPLAGLPAGDFVAAKLASRLLPFAP